jgi:hypothetical protein
LRNVILRFSPAGELIDYVGQGGVSGTPFPYIDSVTIGDTGILTVVCRTISDWIIYSFARTGELRYRFSFAESDLPVPSEGVITSVESVMPGPEPDIVYVKTDYYSPDTGSGDYGFSNSSIHWLDAASAVIEGSINLPPAYKTSGRTQLFNREEEEVIQNLLGVCEGGIFFLLSTASDKLHNLQIVDTTGMVVHKGLLELDDSQTVFRKFHITPDGILTAIIGGNTEADVVVWRTDKFIHGER